MFRLISVQQLERPTASCEHCGHAIAQLFYIHDPETGARMVVGCDCVEQFLFPDERGVLQRLDARLKRAASQWRKQEPAPHQGETRTDYINRRVAEMGNALRGYNTWVGLSQQRRMSQSPNWGTKVAQRVLQMRGMSASDIGWRDAFYDVARQYESRKSDRMFRKIEQVTRSNRFDFTNRYISQIRKL